MTREKKKEKRKMDYNQWVQLAETSQIGQHEQRTSSSLDDWVKDRPNNSSSSPTALDININEFTTLGDLGGKLSLKSPYTWALIPSWIYPIYKLPQQPYHLLLNHSMLHFNTTISSFLRHIQQWHTVPLLGQLSHTFPCPITQV